MSSEVSIEIKNICKHYHIYEKPLDRLKQIFFNGKKQFYKEFKALDNIVFNVKKGETVGIIGRNGSGKSTLLQIICGTLTPTTGDVTILGRVAALLELGAGFNPEFTGRENVYMNAAILGIGKEEIDEKLHDILTFANIGDFIDQPVKTYSSGMYVRLAFSVAINVNPEILIIDEALAVGDIGFQQKCYEKMNEIKKSGVTILLVSHDVQMVRRYCDSAIYLVDGQLMSSGEPEKICEVYLKDLLMENQDVEIKSFDEHKNKISFGNSHGKIISADVFGETSGNVFHKNDSINIVVKFTYDHTVVEPVVFCQIRDEKGYVLYGKRFYTSEFSEREKDSNIESILQVSFYNKLLEGKYSLTCSLNDNPTDIVNIVLDKRVGCSTFHVQLDDDNCHGVIDLEMSDSKSA